ncbi:MAG: DUF6048 family protein [Muribaculaceae bacterium]|nr:DUF6048 family protein [Muribaculaceae bacterium]
MKARITFICLLLAVLASLMMPAQARRRMTPVTTAATTTQSVNETAGDTARINAKRRANSVSFVDEKGRTMYVDTITGEEWTDSTAVKRVPKMEYPLFHALSIGVNIWDPLLRAFGQDYGVADAWLELSLHNRYKPIVEVGLGTASHKPSGMNYTYRSPLSVYFRIGANYNFLFNSNPDYSFFAGLRYGLSPFKYSIDDISLNSPYWDETAHFSIPDQSATVGWLEVVAGLRVKIWGPISAGWTVKYLSIMHQSKARYGKPWYIPGFGARSNPVSGSFSIVYTFGLSHLNKPAPDDVLKEINADAPESAPAEVTDAAGSTSADASVEKSLKSSE